MSISAQEVVERARGAQALWSQEALRQRLQLIKKLAFEIADHGNRLQSAIKRPNASASDILASEVIPLADACSFLVRNAKRILATKRQSQWRGALWMGRVSLATHRVPWGVILVLGPSNYPLFLPGVQAIQAIAAGNTAIVKPAPGCEAPLEELTACIERAGFPQDTIQVLPADVHLAQGVIDSGVDKVILTGSVNTGRTVLDRLTTTLTPSTMELSGCDSVFVLPQANLVEASKTITYGLLLNGGATCIGPRRLFVTQENHAEIRSLLIESIGSAQQACSVPTQTQSHVQSLLAQATAAGANIVLGNASDLGSGPTMLPILVDNVTSDMEIAQADIFAPVLSFLPVDDIPQALAADAECPYRLGASVLGPMPHAEHWAEQIDAGCVTVNDLIVPTADPRVAFGGYDQSGWGVTRGSEGLLEMTRPKTICFRHGKWLPHLKPQPNQDELLKAILEIRHHRSWRQRWASMVRLISLGRSKKP